MIRIRPRARGLEHLQLLWPTVKGVRRTAIAPHTAHPGVRPIARAGAAGGLLCPERETELIGRAAGVRASRVVGGMPRQCGKGVTWSRARVGRRDGSSRTRVRVVVAGYHPDRDLRWLPVGWSVCRQVA